MEIEIEKKDNLYVLKFFHNQKLVYEIANEKRWNLEQIIEVEKTIFVF